MRLSILAVTLFMVGCSPIPAELPKDISENHLLLLVDETFGDSRIVIYSSDVPAHLLSLRRVQVGSAFIVRVFNQHKGQVFQDGGIGEYGPDVIVDYSNASKGVLELTELTQDPRAGLLWEKSENQVPFIKTTVTVHPDGSTGKVEQVLLPPEPGDDTRIADLLAVCKKGYGDDDPHGDMAFAALKQLRNIGIGRPDAAMAALKQVGWDNTLPRDCKDDIERAASINGLPKSRPD